MLNESKLDPSVLRLFDDMEEELEPLLTSLCNHTVYAMIQDPTALQLFMTSHIFAVWDFMTLLKSLQRSLTTMDLPWHPPKHIEAARLVNEIVVGEETDEIYPGVYISHFDLYLLAMEECGADRRPVDKLLKAVVAGKKVGPVLARLDLPQPTKDFVKHTLATAKLSEHRVAASFLFGRENVIPGMFTSLLSHHAEIPETSISPMRLRGREMAYKVATFLQRRYAPRQLRVPDGPPRGEAFRVYLERHIQVDGESHGPMGKRLLMSICGRSRTKWEEATETARASLLARRAMWDGVMHQVQKDRAAIWQDDS